MHDSLLLFALKSAPQARKAEHAALDKQREAKKKKQDLLRQKKLLAAQREYASALMYIDMYHSSACWRTAASAQKHFKKLTSVTAKREVVKGQRRIRVLDLAGTICTTHGQRMELLIHLSNSLAI